MYWPARYYRNLWRAQLANAALWAFIGYGEYVRYDMAGSAWKSALLRNEEHSALALSVVQSESATGIVLAVLLGIGLPLCCWIAVALTEAIVALLEHAKNPRIAGRSAPARALLSAGARRASGAIGAAAEALAFRRKPVAPSRDPIPSDPARWPARKVAA